MKLTPTIALLLSALSPSLAARLTIDIPATSHLQNPSSLPATTLATLHSHGEARTAHLTRDNTFVFTNLTSGSYLLTTHCRDYAFEPLRVDVGVDAEGIEKIEVWQTFRGHEWSNKGEKRGEGLKDVQASLRALGFKDYYQAREGFNAIGFLKSPMILMALFSLVMIVGIPYMMENMDPEMMQEMKDMQSQGGLAGAATNPAQRLQDFDMAGWLAGKTNEEEPTSGSSSSQKGQNKRK